MNPTTNPANLNSDKVRNHQISDHVGIRGNINNSSAKCYNINAASGSGNAIGNGGDAGSSKVAKTDTNPSVPESARKSMIIEANIVNTTNTTTTITKTETTDTAAQISNSSSSSLNLTTTSGTANNTVAPLNSSVANTNGSLSDSFASTDGHRTPNVENLSKTNLYIRGLSAGTNDQDLFDMCSQYGNILSTKAILDKAAGVCKGYGFVQFSSPQTAELAVQELTKSGIQAQMARISLANPSHNHQPSHHNQYSHHQHNQHHHHHHNHHHQQQQQHQMNHHQQHQQQHHHHQHQQQQNHHHQQQQHQQQQHGGGINSNNHVHNHNSSNNNNNNADPTNLYIANLPLDMTELELENLLLNYGPVVSTRILREPMSNNPRGVGFARMETRDKCQEIIEKLNGKPCKGSLEPLLVKFADGGNKKRHNHNNHHYNNNHHHKLHQDDSRWREGANNSAVDVNNYEQQGGNISHANQLPDLAIMSTLSYPRIQHPAYPPSGAPPGAAYPTSMGPASGGPHWIHPATGQPWNMIPQQMIPNPSNQAAAAAAAFQFGHIPQLTAQMQGLQIHPGAPVSGYLPPQHHWPAPMWMAPPPPRLAPPMQHPHQTQPQQQQQQQQQQPQQQQQQQPPPPTQHPPAPQHHLHQQQIRPQQPPVAAIQDAPQQAQGHQIDAKLQVSAPL